MALHLVEGALIAGRFSLVRRLGRGGMGEVWLARHLALDVPCAVKLIDPEAGASPELCARFELEARAAAQIRSAHVVQILDTGVCEGTPYIAMEYLEGEDLLARLARVRVIDPRGTASIIAQAARALEQAHAAGIVHRDLKPGNLFLCREDDREIVKVLDFGVAKRLQGSPGIQTRPDVVLGTLFYMSPEQAQKSRPVDHRSDLWALGVIAFRCLTGQLPFKGAGFIETLKLLIAGPIPVPSRIAPVPIGFDSWWARAASRDPDHRFQSAGDLACSLRAALGLSGSLDPVEPRTEPPIHGLGSTLPLRGGDALPSPRRNVPQATPAPVPARAPTPSMPAAPRPTAAPATPAAPARNKSAAKTRIAVAIAMMALGGLGAWRVFPRSTTSVSRAPANPETGGLTVEAGTNRSPPPREERSR